MAEVTPADYSYAAVQSSDAAFDCYDGSPSPLYNVGCAASDYRLNVGHNATHVDTIGYGEFYRNTTVYPIEVIIDYGDYSIHHP